MAEHDLEEDNKVWALGKGVCQEQSQPSLKRWLGTTEGCERITASFKTNIRKCFFFPWCEFTLRKSSAFEWLQLKGCRESKPSKTQPWRKTKTTEDIEVKRWHVWLRNQLPYILYGWQSTLETSVCPCLVPKLLFRCLLEIWRRTCWANAAWPANEGA